MSQDQKPQSINTEDLTALFHLSVKEDKDGKITSHAQICGSKADIIPMIMQVFLAEPKVVKILKEGLEHADGFKNWFPELVPDFEKLSKQKK
ncbi:hypothetical protein HX096_12830 [Empedobacter falsenii]|uniref:hypothetical protein n=1 Tax=Empedobacter falsenii TaxID=343874 RepID=UPI0025773789|nr:hypothetical protein [Empedobacter falsenii]MDM1548738.1 hypothetical protein [Empedobacter falsenii]